MPVLPVILQPAKVATPLVAPSELPPVQARVPPAPGWVAMARVMELVAVVTVLPPTSSTRHDGLGGPGGAVDPAAGLGAEDQLGGARRW